MRQKLDRAIFREAVQSYIRDNDKDISMLMEYARARKSNRKGTESDRSVAVMKVGVCEGNRTEKEKRNALHSICGSPVGICGGRSDAACQYVCIP